MRDKSRLSDHPEYFLALEVHKGPPPFMTIPLKVEVFHISSDSLEALEVAATTVIKAERHTNEPIWFSTNDAITALIWRSIMVARLSIWTSPCPAVSLP